MIRVRDPRYAKKEKEVRDKDKDIEVVGVPFRDTIGPYLSMRQTS